METEETEADLSERAAVEKQLATLEELRNEIERQRKEVCVCTWFITKSVAEVALTAGRELRTSLALRAVVVLLPLHVQIVPRGVLLLVYGRHLGEK